jgi:integrase-like protein
VSVAERTRAELPVGPLFGVIDDPTRGRPWSSAAVRSEFRRLADEAGISRRFAPHQLRHAHALELAREGVPLNIIHRRLGHASLGTTSIYLQGLDPEEIITAGRTRRPPMMSAAPDSGSEPARAAEAHVALPLCPGEASAPPGMVQTIVARPRQSCGHRRLGRLLAHGSGSARHVRELPFSDVPLAG